MALNQLPDNAAILLEAGRPLRLIGHGFAASIERAYRNHEQDGSGVIRLAVALVCVAGVLASYWLVPALGGLPIGLQSFCGLLLYGLTLPMLAAVSITAAVPALRRFSDATVLLSVVIVSAALATVVAIEQPRQPVALSPLLAGLYLLPALMLLRIPANRGLLAAGVALAAILGILGYRDWAVPSLRAELLLLAALTLPALLSMLVADRFARHQWLCSQLLATSARQDYLTGLLNRRAFEADATEQLKKAARNGTPMALMMLDIDFFKLVNDLYGHARGDQVLKDVADVIGRAGRHAGDLCARYGGEEFAVLWCDCSEVVAKRCVETLLLEIRRLNIENRGSKVADVVTASAGLIAWQDRSVSDIQDGLNQADNLLYMAKRSGRNRLVTLKSAQA